MLRENRVRKHSDFDRIIETGKVIKSSCFSLHYVPSDEGKVGIAVSKKNGGAVTRVKIKRQVRAMLAANYDFSRKIELIIIIKPKYQVGEFKLNQDELVGLLGKIED